MVETQVKLAAISPFFIVSDLGQTVSFYTEKLGFEVRYTGPDGDPFWAMLGRDNVSLFVKVITPEVPPTPNPSRHDWASWDAYVYVPEPEALAADFESRGCEFAQHLGVNSDSMLGFLVKDPNGYAIFFGRPS